MADLADLSFRVDSRPVRTATGDLRDFGEQGKRTARATDTLTESANRAPRATDRLAMSLRGVAGAAAAAYGAFASVRAIYDATESYSRASNALRGIGFSAGQASAALEQVGDIANRTRSPLGATAELYQRITVAGRDLGASQADVLRFTENVGMALAASGTSANEASGALLQLSQAMAGGKVQAEEFNSILEGAFPIAQAAANAIDEAGGSVGRLRALVVEGEISSKEFFDAILSSTDALEAAFGSTVPTISQAMTVLGNSFTMTIGQMDEMTGASGAVAQAIIFLAENVDRLIVYAGTAAAAFGGAYVVSMAAAAVATRGLVGTLVALRGALLRTGIGIAVVAAGELAYQFTELVRKAGGFGGAMSALGPLAVEVWDRIKLGATAMGHGLKAVWHEMAYDFMKKLSEMSGAFSDFMNSAGDKAAKLGLDGVASVFRDITAEAGKASASLMEVANENYLAGAAAKSAGQEMMAAAFAPLETLGALEAATAGVADSADGAAGAAGGLTDALGGPGGSGKGGAAGAAAKLSEEAKAAQKALDDLKRTAESWKDRTATPVEKYRKQLGELNEVAAAGLIGDETYARGIKALNVELADSLPLVGELTDTISEGLFDGFKGTLDSITGIFKRWLAQMIATAAKNQIIVSMGGSIGAGATGGIMSGIAGSSLGGLLGGATLGGIGSTLSGLGTTFFQNAIGIFGADMAGLSATLAGATGSLTGFAAAAGALALPIAGAVAAFDFFRTKTKTLDEGVRLVADGMSVAVQQWAEIRKSRFWGLSTSRSTDYAAAPDDIANPLTKAVGQMQTGIMQAADALGVGKRAFRDFAYQIKLSTEDMTEEEAVRAIQEEMAGLSDAFARMVPGAVKLRQEGERTTDALIRTATTLATVNGAFNSLGFDMLDKSLRGGKVANRLVEMSGGLQQFAQATEFYFDNIMSAPDRLKALTKQFNAALNAANINARPGGVGQFQNRVEKLMDAGKVGKAQSLINLAPLFTEIEKLQAELDTTGDKADGAAERLAGLDKRAADIARERAGLEAQLLRLSGDQKAIRQAEIAALYPANRELQRRIYGLEREAEAATRASQVASERASLQQELWRLQGREDKIRKAALKALDPSNRKLQRRIFALEREAAAAERASEKAMRRAARLAAAEDRADARADRRADRLNARAEERAGLQDRYDQLAGNTAAIRARELAGVDHTNRALTRRIWALEDEKAAIEKANAIADERLGIQRQLWQAEGNTAAIQRDLLSQLDPANRALQQHVWAIEAQAEAATAAAEKAASIANERTGLEERLLQLQGKTGALRAREYWALHPVNRETLERIWALEDEAEAAAKASAIADERTSLEDQLLQLQGNTAELRRRELAGLDASNRSLQLMIWGLEDAAKAMDDLDPEAFATRLGYERARARAVSGVGGVTSAGTPLAVVPSTGPQSVQASNETTAREIRDLVRQVKELTVKVEQNTYKSATIAARQERKAAG